MRTQPTSRRLSRPDPVTRMANGLDGSFCAELLAEAAHTDLDDVRTGIEVVAPDLRQEALAAHDRACVLDEVVEEPELPIREVGHELADVRLATGEVECERAGPDQVFVVA